MIESDYQILKLMDKFYSKYNSTKYSELLKKNNRPYNCLLFETHYDYFICVPFRTNINHDNAYKFSKSKRSKTNKSGLDYSKMVIVKDLNCLDVKNAIIDKDEYKEVVKNIDRIKLEALEYLEEYIKYTLGEGTLHKEEYFRRYKYTTLKYFHNELFGKKNCEIKI